MADIDKGKLLDQAQKYLQKGQIDKAIAEYQKVVDADPKDLRTRLKVAELYLKKGNKKSAIDEYARTAESYADDGFNLQAIAVYKQLLKIDPSIFDVYIKLADLYRRQGLVADALAQYRIVINNYESRGKVREAIDVLKQMASLDIENLSIRVKLADLYFKNGDRKDALEIYAGISNTLKNKGRIDDVITLYEKLLSADPSCAEAHRELGEVYLGMGKKKEALSKLQAALRGVPDDTKALSLLAGVYLELNELDKARLTYEHILRVEPSSADAAKGMITLLIKTGDKEAAVSKAIPFIDKAVQENSYDNALRVLLELYRNDIRERTVLEKMADVYRLKGERDRETEVRDEIERIYGIAVEARRAEEEPEVLEVEEAHVEELPLEGHFVPTVEAEVRAPAEDASRYLTEADVYEKYGLKDKAIDILKTAFYQFPHNNEVRRRLISLGVSLPVPAEEALPELEEVAPEVEEVSLEVEVPEEMPAVEERYPVSRIKEELEEAEFYIQQGLYEEARGVCSRLLEMSPGNEDVLLKLKAIDDAVQAQLLTAEPHAEEAPSEGLFDLAAELEGEEFEVLTMPPGMREAERFGFEDIFSEFKKGVEAQLGAEDTETHYNLGIAYKEMGLLDDAIREFMIASSNPKKALDCYNLIGICYMDKGAPQKAIEVFRKGVELPGRSNDEYASMNYELGRAYEESGMKDKALSAYMETQKRSSGFRDVESRIAGLGGGQEVRKRRVSFV